MKEFINKNIVLVKFIGIVIGVIISVIMINIMTLYLFLVLASGGISTFFFYAIYFLLKEIEKEKDNGLYVALILCDLCSIAFSYMFIKLLIN